MDNQNKEVIDYSDTRMLVLRKQHYMDKYENTMQCEYTCWGYYDGLSIKKVNQPKERSYKKKSNAIVSTLWYGEANETENLNAYFSTQTVGMFRFCDKEEEQKRVNDFWSQDILYPYLMISFVQIANREESLSTANVLENDALKVMSFEDADNRASTDKVKKVLVYQTFDNTSFIIVIKGNSLEDMDNYIVKVSEQENIIYQHTVIGVSEQFLSDFSEIKRSPEKKDYIWKKEKHEIKCHVYDDLKRLAFHLVSDGTERIIRALYQQMESLNQKEEIKGFTDAKQIYRIGHYDSEIVLSETDVFSLLKFVCPKNMGTHDNNLYGRGLYNIESYFHFDEKKFSEFKDKKGDLPEPKKITKWCREQMEGFVRKVEKLREEEKQIADSQYACFMALMQTLNTLSQNERFSMSKDLYCIVYPAFHMFLNLMEEAQKTSMEGEDFYIRHQNIKASLNVFLECVNSILQHTVHTDQTFLMLPGQSGMDYTIPLKLTLMYHWVLQNTINLLNDEPECRYQCIFDPVMETRPETDLISPDPDNRNRLIRIQVSQRTLYTPRHLMIILTHELGHYVGKNTRCRIDRCERLITATTAYISNAILPEEELDDLKELLGHEELEKYKENLKGGMSNAISWELNTKVQSWKDSQKTDNQLYAKEIFGILIRAAYAILLEENGTIDYFINNEMIREFVIRKGPGKRSASEIELLGGLQKNARDNRKRLCEGQKLEKFLEFMFKLYKEVYSDIVSYNLLKYSREDFMESFSVSEGIKIQSDLLEPERNADEILTARLWVMDQVIFKPCFQERAEAVQAIIDTIFECREHYEDLRNYAEICDRSIKESLAGKSDVENIQNFYTLFSNKTNSAEYIFNQILCKNNDYIKMVLKG